MTNSYLKVFVDWRERYQKLSDAEFGRLMRAALAYKAGAAMPELTGREELMWDGIKLDIDRDKEQYEAVCQARRSAGKQGAKARWQDSKCHNDDDKNSKCHLPYGKNGKEEDKDKDKEEDKEEDKDKDKEKVILKDHLSARIDYAEAANAYNELCAPPLPAVQHLSETRKKHIKTGFERLKEIGWSWWDYFTRVRESDFLMGRVGDWHGCGFDWLIKPANRDKVIEGNYSREATGKKEGGPSVEKLWRDLCKAADEMVGLKKYSIYEGLVNGGDPERFYEEKEAKKRACWDGLPAICRGYIGDEDRLAALGKVKHEERERFDFPRFRRFVQEENT